ncbi:hypothetical protein FACS1894105_00530 [Clostridia bacterium]|nr:hypothetical protein FACS1894105_00530 [Clostridia bacterium]
MSDMFVKIKSKIQKYVFTDIAQLIAEIRQYDYALIYRLDKVALVKADTVNELHKMTEVRAFNATSELRVILVGNEYRGRIRMDGEGVDTEVVEESHLLWGSPSGSSDGETILTNSRGTYIRLPFTINAHDRAFVKVRNYLSNNDDTFEFDDYRLVGFSNKEVTPYA